jgi:hypothetical protein
MLNNLKEKLKEGVNGAYSTVNEGYNNFRENASNAIDSAKNTANYITDSVRNPSTILTKIKDIITEKDTITWYFNMYFIIIGIIYILFGFIFTNCVWNNLVKVYNIVNSNFIEIPTVITTPHSTPEPQCIEPKDKSNNKLSNKPKGSSISKSKLSTKNK